jgi:hypothetical protein
VDGTQESLWSNLGMLLAEHNMSVLALHKRLQEKGVSVNLKSLYRLAAFQPLQKFDARIVKPICLVLGIDLKRINFFGKTRAESFEAGPNYLARDLETAGYAHLRNARNCYGRWGADGKVQQLIRLYPHLAASEGRPPVSLNATIGTPVGQLDAETVARASQALSGEIVLPKLIERLMRIAVEHAGAERGLLILLRGSEPLIEAEATTGHGRVDRIRAQILFGRYKYLSVCRAFGS